MIIAARSAGQLAPLGRTDPDCRAGEHGRRARRRRRQALEAERRGAGAGRHGGLEFNRRRQADCGDHKNEEPHLNRNGKLIGCYNALE